MRALRSVLAWLLRFAVLVAAYALLFLLGALPVSRALPADAASEPGLLSPAAGLLAIAVVNVGVVASLVLTSRRHGLALALALALATWGTGTVLAQIETAFFLSSVSVDPGLLPALFAMGVPTSFGFVPLAVWVLGRARPRAGEATPAPVPALPRREAAWRLALLVVAYLCLYWGAGYFIAWQNPALRAFYGQPGEALPFFAHTLHMLRAEPLLLPLQCARALLWVAFALPVIRGSRVGRGSTALLVGLLFALPPNVSHLIANPLMPVASVRLSHLVETASSTFVFGVLVAALLYRRSSAVGRAGGLDRRESVVASRPAFRRGEHG